MLTGRPVAALSLFVGVPPWPRLGLAVLGGLSRPSAYSSSVRRDPGQRRWPWRLPR